MQKLMYKPKLHPAFTIVELLIVIVVIGVLAAITIVSFGNITGQANIATIQSDLNSNSRKLQLYSTQYSSYPTALDTNNCPSAPVADTSYCIKLSSGNTLNSYTATSTTFNLKITRGTLTYQITQDTGPTSTAAITCPTGFIIVPGSVTYGTSNFCVMKYEARCALISTPTVGLSSPTESWNVYVNTTTPCTAANSRGVVSTSTGLPIARIDQTTASTYATNTLGCTGCKLITEAEWLTIAQNVLSNPSNWSGNAVGSGYIFSGHNDNGPGTALTAPSSDTDGYSGTGQSSGNQKRTLTLTNGEVIWDFSGNMVEWTSGQTTGGQPTGTPFAWREWTAVSGGTISPSPFPATTGLTGASTWNQSNGIGLVYSNSADSSARAFLRSGGWDGDTNNGGPRAGVLTLNMSAAPSATDPVIGFRVSR